MGTRERIVEAADRLFYEQGYEATSFASIAGAVGISRGNFYHHFKSKDAILEAVIQTRLQSSREMFAAWSDGDAGPLERIRRFAAIVIDNQSDIENYGCPVGTLTGELAKLGHPARPHAVDVFDLFRAWLREQFAELGHESVADSLALHVLTFSQGVATLSNAFHDREYVDRELASLNQWLEQL